MDVFTCFWYLVLDSNASSEWSRFQVSLAQADLSPLLLCLTLQASLSSSLATFTVVIHQRRHLLYPVHPESPMPGPVPGSG